MHTNSISRVVSRPPLLEGEVRPSKAQAMVQMVMASIWGNRGRRTDEREQIEGNREMIRVR